MVVEADGLRKGYGDRLLIEDLSFTLPPAAASSASSAPNGAGKTTLLRMITGEEEPDGGQRCASATPSSSPTSTSPATRSTPTRPSGRRSPAAGPDQGRRPQVDSRAYVAGFNFKGSDQQKKVGTLSGGERNRVHLAKLLRRGGNLLLLDEPTNDLDVDTLRALEEALLELRRLRGGRLPRPLVPRPRRAPTSSPSRATPRSTWFEGNFEAYEESAPRERLGEEADRPHRITYKKLTRA